MRIEKISETQIKFVLSQKDLEERGIRMEELSSATAKTQSLFREMMEQAMEECSFTAENTPLMIEAVPVAYEGIMVIVTKLPEGETGEAPMTLFTQHKDPRRFKKTGFIDHSESSPDDGNLCIYSFTALDDVIDVSARLYGSYAGNSDLFKHQGKYFLVLQNSGETDLDLVLGEYGQKHVSSALSKYYLVEHGEKMLMKHAVDTLAEHLG